MGKRIAIILWRVFAAALILVLATIVYFSSLDPSVRGWWFRHEMLSALDDASSVQVVEHSSHFDSITERNNPNYKDVIYATVTLKPDQIESLRKALPLTLDYSGTRMKMCMFEEHHYIAITRRDGSVLTLHICFRCGQIKLGSHYGDMPEGWAASLNGFVTSLGLHPNGPWDTNPDAPK
jgi:hypothetical protein